MGRERREGEGKGGVRGHRLLGAGPWTVGGCWADAQGLRTRANRRTLFKSIFSRSTAHGWAPPSSARAQRKLCAISPRLPPTTRFLLTTRCRARCPRRCEVCRGHCRSRSVVGGRRWRTRECARTPRLLVALLLHRGGGQPWMLSLRAPPGATPAPSAVRTRGLGFQKGRPVIVGEGHGCSFG